MKKVPLFEGEVNGVDRGSSHQLSLHKELLLVLRVTSLNELNLTHKISNEIDTVEDKKQLNEPLPNDL